MNICKTNVPYDASYYTFVAGLVRKLNRGSIELAAFEKTIKDKFTKDDSESIISWIQENPNVVFPSNFHVSTASSMTSIVNDGLKQVLNPFDTNVELTVNPFNNDVSYYYSEYGGNAKMDADDLQQEINSLLVFELLYNPFTKTIVNPNSLSSYSDYTEINHRLRLLQFAFAKDVAVRFGIKANSEFNINNNIEFTKFINDVTRKAARILAMKKFNQTANVVDEYFIKKEDLDAFIKLAKFDDLVLNSKFVKLQEGEENNNVFSHSRYEYSGEVVYSKSQYEEHADAKDYTSKFISSILDAIEETDVNHKDGNGVKIGTNGFNYVITRVNEYFSKTNHTNKHKIPYRSRIKEWLGNSSITPRMRRICNSLLKYLFNEDVPIEIQEIFTTQAETVVRSSYQEYQLGNVKMTQSDGKVVNIPGVTYLNTSDRIIDQTKGRLAASLSSKLRYLKQNKQNVDEFGFKTKSGFTIKKEGDTVIIQDPNGGSLSIKYGDSTFIISNNSGVHPEHNESWAKLLNELLDLPLLDKKIWDPLLATDELLPSKFINMLALITNAYYGNFKHITTSDNKISYTKLLPFIESSAAFMMPIYSDEVNTVVKDQHGHNIPPYQMTSIAYEIQSFIDEILDTLDHVQRDNFFISNRNSVVLTHLRESVMIGSNVRNVADMGFAENEQLKIMVDFYQRLLRDRHIVLQPMTYADKTRHILYEVATNLINIGDQNAYDLLKILVNEYLFNNDKLNEKTQNAETLFLDEIIKRRLSAYTNSLNSVLNRFAPILNVTLTGDIKTDINLINEALKKYTTKEFEFLIHKKIDFYPENDVSKIGDVFQLNTMLTSMYDILSDKNKAERYFTMKKYEYFKALKDESFKLAISRDPSLKELYFNKLNQQTSKDWINSAAGTMKLAQFRNKSGKIIESVTDDDIVNGNVTVELNPMLNGYFWANNLFGEQLRVIQMGQDYNISGKGDGMSSIESKFVANTKRAMGQGSTIMKARPKRFGISNNTRGCMMNDIVAPVYNPQGLENKDELAFDGGGFMSPIELIRLQWSLPGNISLRGNVVKTIIQYVDKFGALNQIKWAANTLSNYKRRGCLYSDDNIDLNVMFSKTHGDSINMLFNLSNYYGKLISSVDNHVITCTEDVYYKDINTGKHYKIISVKNNGNLATRTVVEVDINGNEIFDVVNGVKVLRTKEDPKYIQNIADLHEFFGGIYCKTLNKATGELEYSEINNEILANIVCANNLDDKFIPYVCPKSTVKVGMHNLNRSDIFSVDNNDSIWEFNINLSHYGVQLDAGHEVEGGHVTEGSQMISLVTERGFSIDLVNDLYTQIAEVTKTATNKLRDESVVKEVLSEILIESLDKNTGDIVSVTDDFIKQLKNKAKERGGSIELYFSSPDIRAKFASAVCASLNRYALRRKYAGLGAVQTSSYDQMTIATINGNHMTMEDLVEEYRDALNQGLSIQDLFRDPNSINKNILSNEHFERLRNVVGKNKTRVIEIVPDLEGSYRDVYFEDTIVYKNENLEWVAEKIKDIRTYNKWRHSKQVIYKWNTRPRNLLQTMQKFDVQDASNHNNVQTWTLYDLPQSRIIGCINSALRGDIYLDEIEFLSNYGYIYKDGKLSYGNVIITEKNVLSYIKSHADALQQTLINIQNALNSNKSYEIEDLQSNRIYEITGTSNDGAQIMIGNPWLKEFDLSINDSLYKILNTPDYFIKRLQSKYVYRYDDVSIGKYDAILYENDGTPIFIQFGSDSQNADRIKRLQEGNSFKTINNNIYYKGIDLGNKIGIKEFVYAHDNGSKYKVIRLSDPSRLNALLKTKAFDRVTYNMSHKSDLRLLFNHIFNFSGDRASRDFVFGKYVIKKGTKLDINHLQKVLGNDFINGLRTEFNNRQKERLSRSLEVLGKQREKAFKKLLTCMGTRIPSQALSSIAKCQIVGFTGSLTNDVYLPRVLTWVAGSDYDIDKFFIMMYEVMNNGTLPNIYSSDIMFDTSDIDKIKTKYKDLKDPIEIGVTLNLTDPSAFVITEEMMKNIEDGSEIGLLNLKQIFAAISEGRSIKLYTDSSLITVTDEGRLTGEMLHYILYDINDINLQDLAFKIENIINSIITLDKNEISKRYLEAYEKNKVVDNLQQIVSTPSTQIALQSLVSAEEGKLAVKAVEEEYGKPQTDPMTFDNPACITKQQIANMVGKMGIASVAIAKKAYDGISFAFNSTVMSVTNEVIKNGGALTEELENKIRSLFIEKKDGGYVSIANVNFQLLIDALNDDYQYFKDELIPIQKIINKNSAIDYFSTLMTLATDNAKELLLARLNAVDENIDFYAYLFATGSTFIDAAFKIKAPLFEIIQSIQQKNIFKRGSDFIRLKDAIAFVKNEQYLSTVNASIMRKALLGDRDMQEIDGKPKTPFAWLALNRSQEFNKEFGDVIDYYNKKHDHSSDKNLTKEEKFVAYYLGIDDEFRKFVINYFRDLPTKSNIFNKHFADEFDYGVDDYNEMFESTRKYVDLKKLSQESKYELNEYIEEWINTIVKVQSLKSKYPRKYRDDEAIINELEILSNLSKQSHEFSILGRYIFSINQGMHVGDYESWSWVANIESAINQLFVDKGLDFIPIDFLEFIINDDYAIQMINQYDKVKETVNILKVVRDNHHFMEMLKTTELARNLLQHARVTKIVHKIANNIVAKNHTSYSFGTIDRTKNWTKAQGKDYDYERITKKLTKKEYKAITEAVNERLVFEFFKHLSDVGGFTIDIDSNITINGYYDQNCDLIDDKSTTKFELHTLSGMMNFKRWMDNYVFPVLKGKMPELGNALQLSESYNKTWDKSKFGWQIDRSIASAKPGEALYKKKAAIITEFGNRARGKASDYIKGINSNITLGDLLYLYNLMVYKDGNEGLTFLFSNLAASKNPTDWINKFQSYVKNIDDNKINPVDENGNIIGYEYLLHVQPRDVFFYMMNDDNAWKFGLTKHEDGWTHKTSGNTFAISRKQFNSDAPFDSPSIYDDVDVKWTGFTIESGKEYNVDNITVVEEIISNLNSLLFGSGIKIHAIDTKDLSKYRSSNSVMFENVTEDEAERIMKSNGFVFNGDVYIVIDRADGKTKTMVHELMHLICANLHYNPRYAQKYHEKINSLWFDQDKATKDLYEETYPNKKASDLREEFFVEYVAKLINDSLSNKLNKVFIDKLSEQQLKEDIFKSLQDVFGIISLEPTDDLDKLLGNFAHSDVNTILPLFKSALFDFEYHGFNSTRVVLSQELATVKNMLFEEDKIIEDCK